MVATAAPGLRARLGALGIWSSFDGSTAAEVLRFAAVVEDLGYGTLWVNEGTDGREPFAMLGALATSTGRLTLGLGIASIYARDAVAAHAGARAIAELSGERFVMGLGVSHRSSAGARGHEYGKPLPTMSAYLEAYRSAPSSATAVDDPPLVLAALGDGMLRLAAGRADGAFAFLVPVGAVRRARAVLDAEAGDIDNRPRPVLVVSQPAILASGDDARPAARAMVARYLTQPNYRANLARAGFPEEAIAEVDDALVDALVATGDAGSLRARIAAMHDAGADHVAVIPVSVDGRQPDPALTRAIAP